MSSARPEPEDPLLKALAEYWDEILGLADDAQREYLGQLVAGAVDPDPVNSRAALADLLLDLLPPGHPVVPLLSVTMYDPGGRSAVAGEEQLARSWSTLRALVLSPDDAAARGRRGVPDRSAARPPELRDFDRLVQGRLLSVPWVSPDELRRRGVDPDGDGLIRLSGPERGVQLPAFQFSSGTGQPWPAAEAVNRLLGAAADPWGVTCWWVDPHAGLGGDPPADLLGRDQDEALFRMAAWVGAD
jgi:hypothetical protein